MLPYIEVSHLPSSSSFYSAILQPLGLRCVSPSPKTDSSSLHPVTYGVDEDSLVLQIRQSENPLKPPRLSSLAISVATDAAVTGFHHCWLRTEPPSWSLFRDSRGLEQLFGDRDSARAGPWVSRENGIPVKRTVAYDHDGNRLEVLRLGSGSSRAAASKSLRDWPRILKWDFDVAHDRHHTDRSSTDTIDPPVSAMAPPDHEPRYTVARRSSHGAPASSAAPQLPQESATPRQSSRVGGLNTTTVVGALLGVAAGAVVTYGLVSHSSETPRQREQEFPGPERIPRRATFPEKPVTGHDYPKGFSDDHKTIIDPRKPRKFSHDGIRSLPIRGAHTIDDEDVEYGIEAAPAPAYTSWRAPSRDRSRVGPPSTTRQLDYPRDKHSQISCKPSGAPRSASIRGRSEAPRERVALVPDDRWERRSHVPPGRQSVATEPVVSRPPLSRSHRCNQDTDRDSFISARSHRSTSTARQLDREPQYAEARRASRSRPASHVSRASTERGRPRDRSRAASQVSARRVPLPGSAVGSSHAHWDPWDIPAPRSAVGSSHAHWDPWDVPLPRSGVGSSHADWDDDMQSLAPSDSISCAGVKTRRSRRRH